MLERERRQQRGELEADDDCCEREERKGGEEVRPGRGAWLGDAREGGRGDKEREGDLHCAEQLVDQPSREPTADKEDGKSAPRGNASMLGRVRPAQNGTWNWVAARTRKYLATFAPYADRTERER